ncbi:MAG: flagellar biosynthesis protein FlhB [Alphaproteobacteria bacterium]|nr:flagellar biosynthesis protein FlhB [Alphaproteobacteria bacterium]
MAENDDDSQKTEEPTHKRLTDSRNKGDVAQSREVANWFMLFSAAVAVALFAPFSAERIYAVSYQFLENPHQILVSPDSLRKIFVEVWFAVGFAIAAPIGLFLIAAVSSSLVQYGLLFAPEKIKPTLSKISPLAGVKRMFSLRSVTELLKGLVKISLVAAITLVVVSPIFDKISLLPSMTVPISLGVLHDSITRLLVGVVSVVTALALLDFFYQLYEHRKKLRMTQQEVRDEMRQSEGDPHIKARLRQIRTERARQRMMQAVPEADVVITNPTHYAIALKYDHDEMDAPKVVAKGVDEVARRIRERAEEYDVTLFENPPLARALYAAVDINDYIKPEHYEAVAEIIAFVMGIKKDRPRPMAETAFDEAPEAGD